MRWRVVVECLVGETRGEGRWLCVVGRRNGGLLHCDIVVPRRPGDFESRYELISWLGMLSGGDVRLESKSFLWSSLATFPKIIN